MSTRPLLLAARALAAVGLATLSASSLGATGEPTPTPSTPSTRMGLPPATAQFDIAPVVDPIAPVIDLVAPVSDLLSRTSSLDGAIAHDAGDERERYTLAGDVFFDFDSADLTDRARTDLAEIADELAAADIASLTVVGHTDSVASDAYNDTLSLERATAVRDVLAEALPGVDIAVEGRGEREPVAEEQGSADEVEQARALNRRVEITAALKDGVAD